MLVAVRKIICSISLLLCLCSVSLADYIVSGVGQTKGEAYVEAMGNAPSGQWIIKSVRYSPASACRVSCTIVWTQKK